MQVLSVPNFQSPLLTLLRQHTSARHRALDAGVRLRNADDYPVFLRGSLAALDPLERVGTWLPELGVGQRRFALQADLAELGVEPLPAASCGVTPPQDLSEAYGCAYVLEGSALGGAVLARRIKLARPDAPTRFLELHGRGLAERWRRFLDELARHDRTIDDAARGRACASACAVFDHYARALRYAGALHG